MSEVRIATRKGLFGGYCYKAEMDGRFVLEGWTAGSRHDAEQEAERLMQSWTKAAPKLCRWEAKT